MHEEINELLAGYALGDLSELESLRVKEHLYECEQCRGELERLEGLLACTQHMSKLSADEHLCKSAKKSLFAAIESAEIKTQPERPKTGLALIGRFIMNNKIKAFATAGVLIICVLLGVNLINKPTTSGVAWGSIVERLEKIDCYTFKKRVTSTPIHGPVITEESDMYCSSQYGYLMDLNWKEIGLNIKIYTSFLDNTITMVYPRIKKYYRVIPLKGQITMMQDFLGNPGHILKEAMSFNYEELSSKIIDGKKVEGIEINDPRFMKGEVENCVARLWVDVETNLPVLYETRATVDGGTRQLEQVMDGFKWDPVLDENIFKPDLTEYTLVAEVAGPPPSEETAVQMLRSFSELSGGNYPDSLNWMNCDKEINTIYREKKIGEIGLKRAILFWEEDDFEWEPFAKLKMQVSRTCHSFYSRLVREGKDVAYHGKTVTAEDTDMPLMRWKISDALYRVIFGDLRIKNVGVEELAELEADLKKLQFLHFPAPDPISEPPTPGVVWGSLVERLEKIDNYTFRKRQTTIGQGVKETSDIYYSSRYGGLMDLKWHWMKGGLNIKIYNSFSDNTSTVVYPRIKKHYRIIASGKEVVGISDILGSIVRDITSLNYDKLGSKVIDGKKVEGIEVDDPRYAKGVAESCVARLWVDVETNLPVLYEARATVGGGTMQIEQVIDGFKWNSDLDAHIFEPDLTEYSLVAEVPEQPPSKETAVHMLRTFSKMAGGKYPANLALVTCNKEINRIYLQRKIKEIGLERAILFWEEDDFEWESFTKLNMQIHRTCSMFYGQLVKEEKDVAYHGKIVTAKDTNAPLMRWKIADDLYRVLFGDLSIKDVSIEELAELEADLKDLQFLKFPTPDLIGESTIPGVAWGSLYERIEKIDGYTFKRQETTTFTNAPVVRENSDVYFSSKYGFLDDRNWSEIDLNVKIYGSISDNTVMVVYPRIKKYYRIILSEKEAIIGIDFLRILVKEMKTFQLI